MFRLVLLIILLDDNELIASSGCDIRNERKKDSES